MFGVDIDDPVIMLNGNKSEVNNSSKIKSILNKWNRMERKAYVQIL